MLIKDLYKKFNLNNKTKTILIAPTTCGKLNIPMPKINGKKIIYYHTNDILKDCYERIKMNYE